MRGSVKKYHLYKKLSSLLVVNFYIPVRGLGRRDKRSATGSQWLRQMLTFAS